ncbi:MAG: dicarboxylate/amino acid:cation symporter [Planctomycetes bacterium]|nr:dicarboxylate/amino acid:cation symporter [Planctomycetota bacterium]|tara:strand:+ start:31680 stop:32984 length:1305 start_codon:yes stop_codon:yes gene_type:complete
MCLGAIAGVAFQHFTEAVWVDSPGANGMIISHLDPECERAAWLAPLSMVADIFMRLLKMLIVPLILSSIVTGVTSVAGGKEFGRLGGKTLLYYMTTSLFAICGGLLVVNLFQPGTGAELVLSIPEQFDAGQGRSFADIFVRMVPPNIFEALTQNGQMLQVIVFALILGFFIAKSPEPHGPRIRGLFESFFEVMMRVAEWVLSLVPYGVFALVAKVVGETGLAAFKPLLFFMAIVAGTLLLHAVVVLPLILRFVGKVSPIGWARAMSPALMTAFTTSSSSMTLPVTLECAEKRGKAGNKISSFVLPLGATINMDGTALYECVGVIFLSQYYASHSPAFDLTMGMQFLVVIMALLASIGAAGIPSAGLVLKATILQALGLPDDGVLLLLAIDRPLDMLRTAVNVWSDSCGVALIAKSEGLPVLLEEPPPAPTPAGG